MNGFYEESSYVKKQRLLREAAEKNQYGVKVGQVYRGWDPRDRKQADDKVTQYIVSEVKGMFAACFAHWPNGNVRRASIRLDRFSPKNYKLLKDVV